MARERILVVDTDLNHLSRLYLALLHRKYRTEACNNPEEIQDRTKRFKPSLIILYDSEYEIIKDRLKIPAIVFGMEAPLKVNDGDTFLKKPIQIEQLLKKVEEILF